ncbi:MAG TPA: M1 family aminopeptidase [Gammaproteobacteria bacterium]|nr:M1 family aminopeptidase [Gammaproteobacteria bacterium]
MSGVKHTAGIGLILVVLGAAPTWAADLPPFGDPAVSHWAPSRGYHVEDYRLALHFDQARGEVFGDETVTLRPFETGFKRFYLDSAELSIDSVTLLPPKGKPLALKFDAEDPHLWIDLDRDYAPQDKLRVRIVYHGKPRFGLFFDNPSAAYPDTPREIWTQGESEFNHFWFPCWDYPNDMATSELVVTVPKGQVVVSNGRLAGVTHAGGEDTYDWVEAVPHSTYLTSLAIGPFERVHDSYHGKPVDYYAPRGTDEATVRRAFGLTPDMIGFFSRISVEYPYEKYDQVAVRDFFFGGMENVSATTLQEWALQDPRASEDFPVAETVAHELAQHWFGDYAQGRDWADIWLNEGFATYLPALYTQYHVDYDAYRFQMLGYQDEALRQDREDYLRPIVDRHYHDGMDMFDSITHEKGAAVLDMLRYVLDGPEAVTRIGSQQEPFFQVLRAYLEAHRAQAVDTSALVAAVRETTGQDMGWFFHQWVYLAGTPAYKVSAAYDAATKTESVTVVQTQQGTDVPAVFRMPIQLAFHGAGGAAKSVMVDDAQATQSFSVPLDFEPAWVDFDPDGYIEKRLDFPQPVAALAAAAEQDPSMRARLWAAGELGKAQGPDTDPAQAALAEVLSSDRFYGVRAAAAASLGALGGDAARGTLLANLRQPDSRVRMAVVQALGRWHGDAAVFTALADMLRQDPSYAVQVSAAAAIGTSASPEAFPLLQDEFAGHHDVHVQRALLGALAATHDPRAVPMLLAAGRPGSPIRLRLSAFAGLTAMRDLVQRDHAEELASLVGAGLHDTYIPLQQSAQQLVASFHLTQFKPELEAEATQAPSEWQRQIAKAALQQLQASAP